MLRLNFYDKKIKNIINYLIFTKIFTKLHIKNYKISK